MNITRGKIAHAKKVVIYGPEGIGKSTLASKFPDPVYIDTEGGTRDLDVARLDDPGSWDVLLEEAEYIAQNPGICKTLVIDTADWAEQACIEKLNKEKKTSNILTMDYGKGSLFVVAEFKKLIDCLDRIIRSGVNVAILAHASMRKFEQPDEMGAYDRWELKLQSKQVKAMVKEWADMVLFCSYKTNVVAADKEGKKKKATGRGRRVIYTTHHSCWDAKNRSGLPDELPLDYESIKNVIEDTKTASTSEREKTKSVKKEANTSEKVEKSTNTSEKEGKAEKQKTERQKTEEVVAKRKAEIEEAKKKEEEQSQEKEPTQIEITLPPAPETGEPDAGIPKELRELMIRDGVTEWDIENLVGGKGYYPLDMRVRDYDGEFVREALVKSWDKVLEMIKKMREEEAIPF